MTAYDNMKIVQVDSPSFLPHCKAFFMGDCKIFVGVEMGLWHLSISRPDRYPNWDEIKTARYELVPDDVTMAMLLPPKDQYVNLHLNCFHLHQIRE